MESKTKTEFGADKEADNILNQLPRTSASGILRHGPNAWVTVDGAGRLCIVTEYGLLTINEVDLYKIHGDELFDGGS